jgi:hypothetical protein
MMALVAFIKITGSVGGVALVSGHDRHSSGLMQMIFEGLATGEPNLSLSATFGQDAFILIYHPGQVGAVRHWRKMLRHNLL